MYTHTHKYTCICQNETLFTIQYYSNYDKLVYNLKHTLKHRMPIKMKIIRGFLHKIFYKDNIHANMTFTGKIIIYVTLTTILFTFSNG